MAQKDGKHYDDQCSPSFTGNGLWINKKPHNCMLELTFEFPFFLLCCKKGQNVMEVQNGTF